MKIEQIAGGGYTASIHLSRGANCISLRHETLGVSLLREPDYSRELDNPYLYGMPVLFPVNRISGGRFEFDGRVYELPINEEKTGCTLHGELHAMEFRVDEQNADSITCSYRSNGNYAYMPHDFSLRIQYSLSEKGMRQKTMVVNHSDCRMPLFLGFHTTFNLAFAKNGKPEHCLVFADIAQEIERNMTVYLPTGKVPEFDAVSRNLSRGALDPTVGAVSRHYRAAGGGEMGIFDPDAKLLLRYENDEKFGWRLIYNGDGTQYICLEPQTCMANCPNSPFDREFTGFSWLEPGEEREFISHISCTPATMQEYEEYIKNGTKPKK